MGNGESSNPQPPAQKRPSRLFGQYIIKHRFQFKVSFILASILSVCTLVMWFESHTMVGYLLTSGSITSPEAAAQLELVGKVVGMTGLLLLAVSFGLIVFLSHFVAGPIYRFEKTLQDMSSGNLMVNVTLRKKDELKEMANGFNQALANLRSKLRKEREHIDVNLIKLNKVVESLRQNGQTAEAEHLGKILEELKTGPREIKIS